MITTTTAPESLHRAQLLSLLWVRHTSLLSNFVIPNFVIYNFTFTATLLTLLDLLIHDLHQIHSQPNYIGPREADVNVSKLLSLGEAIGQCRSVHYNFERHVNLNNALLRLYQKEADYTEHTLENLLHEEISVES